MKGHAETQTPPATPDYANVFDGLADYRKQPERTAHAAEQHKLPEPQGLLGSFVLLNLMSERTADRLKAWRKTKPLKRVLTAIQASRAEYKADLKRDDLPREAIAPDTAWRSPSGEVPHPFVVGIEGTTTTYQSQHARETQPTPEPQPAAESPQAVEQLHVRNPQEIDDATADLMWQAALRARAALDAQQAPNNTTTEPVEPSPQYRSHVVRHKRRKPRYSGGISSHFRIKGISYQGRHRKEKPEDFDLAA